MGASLNLWEIIFNFFQFGILFYFVFVNLSSVLFTYLGLRGVINYSRHLPDYALKNLLELNIYIPISIIVPAYNEEKNIVASVRSYLSLHHPVFEVIVVSDGSTDQSLEVLKEAYQLVETPYYIRPGIILTRHVKRAFRSMRYPNLTFIEKENGGKADALNVGINYARYPLVCAVDADSVLDVEALLRASQLFVEDETMVAVSGMIRPLNGAVIKNGQIVDLQAPHKWIERFQVIEYSRAFFIGRAGWAAIDALLIISGAFGLFKREAVLEVGGYSATTVGEDIELVVKMHKYYRGRKQPYRVIFIPDPICWTEVPSDMATLRRQRNRWQRGLWETLWTHRDMLFNPRYGRLGMLAIPYFWLIEALSPIVEIMGYAFVFISILIGILYPELAFWFLALALLCGVLLSQVAIGIEMLLTKRYSHLSDRLILLLAAVLEFFGYRQILLVERFVATFQILKKRGQWGAMTRKGIS
jgi:cellulose synthase/poly-beta-1,6-N-acetylglucosamine synthase-like glycosyltransferase